MMQCVLIQSFEMMVKSHVGRHEGKKKNIRNRKGDEATEELTKMLPASIVSVSQLPNPEAAFHKQLSLVPQTLVEGSLISRKDSRAADTS